MYLEPIPVQSLFPLHRFVLRIEPSTFQIEAILAETVITGRICNDGNIIGDGGLSKAGTGLKGVDDCDGIGIGDGDGIGIGDGDGSIIRAV